MLKAFRSSQLTKAASFPLVPSVASRQNFSRASLLLGRKPATTLSSSPKPINMASRSTALPPAPPPKTPLARYRLLSPTASVRVSPLCLGSMNFGNAWKDYMGTCDQATTEKILDYFYESGGNFIDTANNYQHEESETWIGEWMKKRGNRDQMVIATKYTTNFRAGHAEEIMANSTGNSNKSLHVSVKASLRKLQTDYIDLLYVHWWDYSTQIPELMQQLNHLVSSGKVLYLGISDSPAWIVSKANQYARDHGLAQFSVYQGMWSAATRDFERDILPMAREEGMALAPWGALGGGNFKSEEQRAAQKEGRAIPPSPNHVAISKVLEKIAKAKNTRITSVALAYVMHKTTHVFPIIGGRTVDHLKSNIEALQLSLSDKDIAEIDGAVPFDYGFPHNTIQPNGPFKPQDVWLIHMGGTYDYVDIPKPIAPSQDKYTLKNAE